MTKQMTDRDIEQALGAWADDVAPKSAPGRLLEATFAHTMGARQERVYPWLKLRPRTRALTYSGSAARFAIAGLVLMLALVLGAGFIGGAFRPTIGPTPSPPITPSPTPEVTKSPTLAPTASLPEAIPVAVDGTVDVTSTIAMVTDGQLLWLLAEDGHIDQIDAAAEAITGSVTGGSPTGQYNGLAWSEQGLWATSGEPRFVYRFDVGPLALAASIKGTYAPKGVLATADAVWVADLHGGAVVRIDPVTNEVVATISVGQKGASGPNWLGDGIGSIWMGVPNEQTIVRIDPLTDAVQATIEVSGAFTPCGGMAFADDAAWMTSCSAGTTMARIDANSNTFVTTIDMRGNGYNPILINGFIWVSVDGGSPESGKIIGINPKTNSIDRVLIPATTFGGGGDIVVAAGSVWVVDGYHGTVLRLPMTAFGA